MVSDNKHGDENEPDLRVERFLGKRSDEKRLIIVLENANLETVRVGDTHQLLNSDKHQNLLKKHKREVESARPDILHQCLMMLLDSPLNQSGLLQIFIHTQRNILIQVNPQIRIPRTFERFSGLMIQLLHKLSIKATDSGTKLMKVIKNPLVDHLPSGCRKIVTSYKADKLVKARELAPMDSPVVIVVGAMSHGSVSVDYEEERVSLSNFPLSAALVCSKVCTGFEEAWNVV